MLHLPNMALVLRWCLPENKILMNLYSKIWIHAIVSTGNKLPLINSDNEAFIYQLLHDCLANQQCTVMAINGSKEHVHLLFLYNPVKSIGEVIEQALEESIPLVNEKFFKASSFSWDKDIRLFSVSESQSSKVQEYIQNQKEFHKEKTFVKELDEFLKVYGLK